MKRLFILISCWLVVFCSTARADDDNFSFGLSREAGIRLLSGEKNIALTTAASSDVRHRLINDIASDMVSTFRPTGLEFVNYEWGVPLMTVQVHLIALPMRQDLYSGKIVLTYSMIARFDKGQARSYSAVWKDSLIFSDYDEEDVRNSFKYITDKFLSDYLEANPRNLIDTSVDTEKNENP